jgi:hypothetical protein
VKVALPRPALSQPERRGSGGGHWHSDHTSRHEVALSLGANATRGRDRHSSASARHLWHRPDVHWPWASAYQQFMQSLALAPHATAWVPTAQTFWTQQPAQSAPQGGGCASPHPPSPKRPPLHPWLMSQRWQGSPFRPHAAGNSPVEHVFGSRQQPEPQFEGSQLGWGRTHAPFRQTFPADCSQ